MKAMNNRTPEQITISFEMTDLPLNETMGTLIYSPPITCNVPIQCKELKGIIRKQLKQYGYTGNTEDFDLMCFSTKPSGLKLDDERVLTKENLISDFEFDKIIIRFYSGNYAELCKELQSIRTREFVPTHFIPRALEGDKEIRSLVGRPMPNGSMISTEPEPVTFNFKTDRVTFAFPITCNVPITYKEFKEIILRELQKYGYTSDTNDGFDYGFDLVCFPGIKLKDEMVITKEGVVITSLLDAYECELKFYSGNYEEVCTAINLSYARALVPKALEEDKTALIYLLDLKLPMLNDLDSVEGKKIVDNFLNKLTEYDIAIRFEKVVEWNSQYPSQTEKLRGFAIESVRESLKRNVRNSLCPMLRFLQQEAATDKELYFDCLKLLKNYIEVKDTFIQRVKSLEKFYKSKESALLESSVPVSAITEVQKTDLKDPAVLYFNGKTAFDNKEYYKSLENFVAALKQGSQLEEVKIGTMVALICCEVQKIPTEHISLPRNMHSGEFKNVREKIFTAIKTLPLEGNRDVKEELSNKALMAISEGKGTAGLIFPAEAEGWKVEFWLSEDFRKEYRQEAKEELERRGILARHSDHQLTVNFTGRGLDNL